MNLIKTAAHWRHGTFALFVLLTLLGILALLNLPLELQPGGDRPEITITTPYLGAGPVEVEDLVTRSIEEQMEQVQGVQEVSSISRTGLSVITLEFEEGNNLNDRLVDVINRLQQADSLPEEADESNVELVGGSSSPMMWIPMLPKEGFKADPDRYRDLVEEVVVPRLRQVTGVGQFVVSGGRQREVEVLVNPQALTDRNLTIGDVVRVLQENNRDIRGGPLELGRREYRVRTLSRSQELEQIEAFILRRDPSGTVYLRDVATVQMGRRSRDSALVFNDVETVVIGIVRQVGANVPNVARGVRSAITELEAQFDQEGEGIQFIYNYDESEYINQAISFVQGNLISGALLAAAVLLLFLGSMRTVAVIALTIPISLIMTFTVMNLFGRTLNIISLAGLSFAIGMMVDNAIVVVENIFTHMQQGKQPLQAAVDGTQEVWASMLGSTLTNVVVFVPLVMVKGEVGQLYIDMAITLSFSTLFSLFAAFTLVPMLSGLFLKQSEALQMMAGGTYHGGNWLERSVAKMSAVFRVFQGRLETLVSATVSWSLGRGRVKRRLLVLAIPIVLLVTSFLLLPPADYLPEGNRNSLLWRNDPMPGTNLPEAIRQSQPVRDWLKSQPEVARVLFVDRPGGNRSINTILKPEFATTRGLSDMVDRMRSVSNQFAGYRFLVPSRTPIFRDPGKEFEVDIIGTDLEQLSQFDGQVAGQLRSLNGIQNVRSNYAFGAGELQVIPNRERLAEVGVAEADVGTVVEASLGGRLASEFVDGNEELDVSVELQDTFVETPEQLRQLPLYTSRGQRIQLSDVAEVRETTGPDVVNHVDLDRSVTLIASLAADAPLGRLVEQAEAQVLAPLRASLPPGYRIQLSGSADRLATALSQLAAAFAFSLFITYLLLAALYRSFLYPWVIMATIPMGMTGALLCLVLANYIPGVIVPLDMITALGFLILTGVVVNNAILLVDRALQLQGEGMDYDESLYEATRDRLRAIFMAAGTSVLGMLPLAVLPGQGTELYQGLGIVLTGGLAFSTILTPTVVPALMGLLYDISGRKSIQTSQHHTSTEAVITIR